MRRKKLSTIMIAAVMMLSVAFVATTTGNYIVDQYTLDITIDGSGTITYIPVGAGDPPEYDDGTVVTLIPNSNLGWTFDGWSGPDETDLEYIGGIWIIDMDGNKELTATFTEDEYTLTINILPLGSGGVIKNPDHVTYTYGIDVNLEAIANPGYTFDCWDGDLTGDVNPNTITMNEDKDIMAYFIQIPGVNIFEGAGPLICGEDSNNVLETLTDELYFDRTIDIEVNESFCWGADSYYLYYPVYTGKASIGNYDLEWHLYDPDSAPAPKIDGTDHIFENVHLNNSGLWIIDNDADHDASNICAMDVTIPAWFWVNGTEILDIRISDDIIYYSEDKDITINVTTDSESLPVLIDVRDDDGSIFDQGNIWANDPDGKFTFSTENFTHAGEYAVYAYRDLDDTIIYYQELPKYYDGTYGDDISVFTADKYNYDFCGPWDPPEYIADAEEITVESAEPNIVLDPTTIYWGFESIIEVNVTDNEGNALDNIDGIKIQNGDGDWIYDVTSDAIEISKGDNDGDYEIKFESGSANWKTLGDNSTSWHVYFGWNVSGDFVEEWNNSAEFTVRGTAPGVTIDVTDDGDGDKRRDMKVNVPDYNTDEIIPTIDIMFTIFGKSYDDFYGDDEEEDWKNISVSGDILFPMDKLNLTQGIGDGEWIATVTPMSPGWIDISIDWEGEGTDTVTIEIVDGGYVGADIDSFFIDGNATFNVIVENFNHNIEEFSDVYLFWKDDGPNKLIDFIDGDGTEEKGKNGIYKVTIDKEDYENRYYAPQDIIIAADSGLEYWGYDMITMNRNHDLVVSCTPTESYAGHETEYKINVSTINGDIPDDDITIDLLDENDNDIWTGIGYDVIDDIILDPGTYRFHAYNNTHDSEGNDGVITIIPYTVTCSPSVLAWLIDNDIDVTFTVSPANEGDLRILNMSDNPHAAIDGEYTDVEIVDGTATLEGVNASELGNVAFEYRPYGGEFKDADGVLRVTTATATPNPSTVYINEPTTVTVTITHPETGAALSGVKVGLESIILNSIPDDEITDSNGQVQFGITTGGSGDITILIEDNFDEDNKFVIRSAVRKIMSIDAPLTVNEGESFTISVRSGGNLITDKTVTIIVEGVGTYTTSSGSVDVIAPTVTTSLDYRIEATAIGYTDDKVTVRVLNVPQLAIIIDDTEILGGTGFTVTIIDDMGRSIIGAKVTFNDKEFTTGVDGQVSLLAPNVDGDYTISTSFAEYKGDSITVHITKVDEETPGFGLLVLISAIGISLIILKRRRK